MPCHRKRMYSVLTPTQSHTRRVANQQAIAFSKRTRPSPPPPPTDLCRCCEPPYRHHHASLGFELGQRCFLDDLATASDCDTGQIPYVSVDGDVYITIINERGRQAQRFADDDGELKKSRRQSGVSYIESRPYFVPPPCSCPRGMVTLRWNPYKVVLLYISASTSSKSDGQ